MKVIKFNNGNINLQITDRYTEYGELVLDDILHDNTLFMNDLYFEVDDSGCLWIIDQNRDLAYDLTFNCFYAEHWKSFAVFRELSQGKTVKLKPYGSVEEVEEFFITE